MNHRALIALLTLIAFFASVPPAARADDSRELGANSLAAKIETASKAAEAEVIAWRRHFHEHPELSNHEVETAKVVAEHLRDLGLEVQTGIALTGVVGTLTGGKPGPVIALRADMDGLPVTERADVPFKSKVRTQYNGQDVGVMHACGHDAHIAIMMGVAKILTGLREEIPGTIKFIFQPAEEGRGGADVMVAEGVLENPAAEAIFGLHVVAGTHAGKLTYRSGGAMASSDSFTITVRGRQTHGAMPWAGVDPITVAAQIILGLQTIPSRQLNLTVSPAVISVGSIHGGVRSNIIPDDVEMVGTIRTLDPEMRLDFHKRIKATAEAIAKAGGAEADVDIRLGAPVTYNDPKLAELMAPTLERVAGRANVSNAPMATGAEDFAFYQEKIPGLFYFIGITPPDTPPTEAAPNHSPLFYIDESGLLLGVRSMANLALDYLEGAPNAGR